MVVAVVVAVVAVVVPVVVSVAVLAGHGVGPLLLGSCCGDGEKG